MTINPLSEAEQAAYGFTHAFKITHADLTETATNTAQAITLMARAAGSHLTRVATRLVTAFKDASDAAFNSDTISVGDGSTADLFLAAQEINENGSEVFAKVGQGTPNVVNAATTAGTLVLTVNSMSAKALNDIDVGELWIFVHIQDLDDIVG